MPMTPEQMMAGLPALLKEIDAVRAHLADEAGEIAEQWDVLTRIGGQRADHAAALLSRLRPHLTALERLAQRAAARIERAVRDPFGRENSAPAP